MNFLINNQVIVFGGNHHNTLGVIRSLGEKNIFPILVLHDSENSFVLQSKYISKSHVVKNETEGVRLIIKEYSEATDPCIIICCSDGASHAVDEHYDELKNKFIIPNGGGKGNISMYMDKENIRNLAETCNIKTPKSWVINKNDKIPEDIKYPCIIKPLVSIEGSKSDIHICNNMSDLTNDLKQIHSERIQIQEFINKEYEYQLIGCRILNNTYDNIIIPGFSKIIRSTEVSNTGYLEYSPIDKFEGVDIEKVENLIRKCNYTGLFSVEFIKSVSGESYFMEINFRNDGNAYSVTAAGCNLPYIWSLGMTDHEIPTEQISVKKTIYVIPELMDFLQSVLTHKISFFKWFKDVMGADAFLLYNANDKKPFYAELKYWEKKAVKKIKRKILDVNWNIGFVEMKEDVFKNNTLNIRWMKYKPDGRWYADPFILKITNEHIILLVEEFYDNIHRGRISRLTVDKKTLELLQSDVVMELSSHLSFPAIYKDNNDIYIYPENSESGSLKIYKYDEGNNSVEYCNILIDEPMTDAVIYKHDNAFYISGTKNPQPNGNKLYIYKSDRFNGEYKLIQELEFPDNTARNAGRMFVWDNKLIRPAQDCNGAYGKGLVFYEVKTENDVFVMNEIKRFYPHNTIYDQGMHTFNRFDNISVVDGRKFRKPMFAKTLLSINNIIKFIKLK